MIQIECNQCQRKLRAPATVAGKSISCPCGTKISVPSATTAVTTTSDFRNAVDPSLQKRTVSSAKNSRDQFSHACSCGRSLRVIRGDKAKTAKCPCGIPFQIPAKELDKVLVLRPAQEHVYLINEEQSRSPGPFDLPIELPTAPTHLPPGANANFVAPSLQYANLRPSKPSIKAGTTTNQQSLFGSTAIYGAAMMVGAIVWFIAGIFILDRIFIYPPVMFVLGLIGLVKGLVNGS